MLVTVHTDGAAVLPAGTHHQRRSIEGERATELVGVVGIRGFEIVRLGSWPRSHRTHRENHQDATRPLHLAHHGNAPCRRLASWVLDAGPPNPPDGAGSASCPVGSWLFIAMFREEVAAAVALAVSSKPCAIGPRFRPCRSE